MEQTEKLRPLRPDEVKAVIKRMYVTQVDDAEQAAFEDWLERTRPHGDADAVGYQWETSGDYLDFCDEWLTELDLIDNLK